MGGRHKGRFLGLWLQEADIRLLDQAAKEDPGAVGRTSRVSRCMWCLNIVKGEK